ncbi:MAG TPA: class I SAM-dependent methyltransferase [Gaiellaceae bacterium]|jgi:SAM-dependent methyltransferase|nr:class I SAM-dependent methyltransferase [Gaiellaceae bacterium]
MSDYSGFFGEDVAARYDDHNDADPAMIDVLAELAGDGRALELAIGTGRVAVPLAERGVTVAGIDNSPPMLERLREKRDDIEFAVGDMTTTRMEGEFSLVYLVFNTISNLTTQDAQVACFENAAAHLRPGGTFVIENGVPDLQLLPRGQTVVPFNVSPTHLGFDVYDVVTQRFSSQHFLIEPDGRVTVNPVEFRYAWPAELDLMARIAGLRLRDRYANWQREAFNEMSRSHVSIYEKA